ncbi:uncharacterized protein LOC129568168 [Sitodiplosis mosellana]|uniref:uncharacterized protein LOC129568168 n=1 Tax=Sitodiplosis mosellana TaxID=263140 RepID=UPI0024445BB3|nr:uncharacterized protein LOC129568168 [Sitodiplosis mosellana]
MESDNFVINHRTMWTVFGAFIVFALAFCFHCDASQSSSISADPHNRVSFSSVKEILDTFKDFDLIELQKYFSANPMNRYAIVIVFKHRYLYEQFVINSPNLSPNGTFNDTLDVVQNFGHLIKMLKVDYRLLDTDQSAALNKILNDRSSYSLVDVELVHCDDDKILDLRGPFLNVESVQLRMGNLRTNASRFDKIFPALRRLHLGEMYYTHAGCFEHNFPHLESLTVEFWYGSYPHTAVLLETRLRANPQLKHVTIIRCTWNMLEILSKYSTQLESLTLEQFHDDSVFEGKEIRFNSLKVFKFKPRSAFKKNIGRIPIVFEKLEEIEFHNSPDEWIAIMQKNKGLKIVTTGKLDDLQFIHVLCVVPNIQELYTGYNAISPCNNILRFIRGAKHLKRILFTAFDHRVLNQIYKRIDHEWDLLPGGMLVRN